MSDQNNSPELKILINHWTLLEEADSSTESGLDHQLNLIQDAGFSAYSGSYFFPGLKKQLADRGFSFGGFFDAASADEFQEKIAGCLEIGDGPINCQLADHDTSVEEAIELTIALMEESEKQGARVHLEVHRDTCTETPEKVAAIIEGYRKAKGKYPLVNFDYSHPAVVKHLVPENYIDRLFEDIEGFQLSNLWHMRPFNGQHCMIPITNGKGAFSPEYEDCRPFIREALKHWLAGPRPDNCLWVVPEQGTTVGYNLSCFPNVWQDTVALGNDIQKIWNELVSE